MFYLVLLIIIFAADVVMEGHFQLVNFVRPVTYIKFTFKYFLYGFIIISSITERPLTGFNQSLIANFFCKT